MILIIKHLSLYLLCFTALFAKTIETPVSSYDHGRGHNNDSGKRVVIVKIMVALRQIC